MKFVKNTLIAVIAIFFKIYFFVFGEPKIDKKLKQALSLYKVGGFSELFSIIRSWDAPYLEIESVVPKSGLIVDLGSGDGLLSNYLAIASSKRKIIGIEINKGRLKESDKGLKNVKFTLGDIVKEKIPESNAIILAHVLHHLNSFSEQVELLKLCRKKLKRGGKLIIIEIIETPFLKFIFTALVDYFVLPALFEGKLISSKIHYRSVSGWKETLKNVGFSNRFKLIHKGMPFSHVIIESK